MYDFETDALNDEENDALIDKLAQEILKRKMEVPAVLMLEMHKPLSYVASQASIVFAPFIVPLAGYDNAQSITRLLSRRENVEKLISRIETLSAIARQSKGAQIG